MSNSLIKLIDNALLPAVLLIFGKFFGLYIFSNLFGIQLAFSDTRDALLYLRPVVVDQQIVDLSTYSDLFMFLVVSIGFLVVIIRSAVLNESRVSVDTVTKLAKFNLVKIVRSSYELYHSGVVWLIFTWVANFIIVLNYISQKTQLWLLVISSIFTLLLTVLLLRDVFKEIQLTRKNYNN